jgi:xanthine dehydrogenase YagT iron-sulfur-binding subunit
VEYHPQFPRELALSRRDLLIGTAASVAVTTVPSVAYAQATAIRESVMSKVSFEVNGKPRELELDTRATLLDALREHPRRAATTVNAGHAP